MRRTRVLAWTLCIAVVVGGGVIGVRALWNAAKKQFSTQDCTVAGYDLDPEQASVAATIAGAVAKFSPPLPERATVLVLAAGLQESKLHNLSPGEGDRDSVGFLQQRPSQGWGHGDPAVLNNVGEATREFLAALVKVPHWRTRPLADVVQDIQISADGSAYAQHEPEALALAQALDGSRPAAISCEFDAPTKVASPARVAELLRGDLPVRRPAVGADTVSVRGAHWQTAAWFVAYSYQLGIEQVGYDGHTWIRGHGWTKSAAPAGRVVATLYRHR